MPPEYRIIKVPFDQQEFCNDVMRSFGWQVQGVQETVDRIDSSASSTGMSSNWGQQNATIFSPSGPYTYVTGNSQGMGWSNQRGSGSTQVHSVLSVTFVRDSAIPNRNELARLEARCFEDIDEYHRRIKKGLPSGYSGHHECTFEWQRVIHGMKAGENLLQPPGNGQPGRARFHKLEMSGTEHLRFSLSFAIWNRKSLHCQVLVSFWEDSGKVLQCEDRLYCDGRAAEPYVACSTYVRPAEDGWQWDNLELQLPFAQLHQSRRKGVLRYRAEIEDVHSSRPIAWTDDRRFSYSRSAWSGKVTVVNLSTEPVQTLGQGQEPDASPPKPSPAASAPPQPQPSKASPAATPQSAKVAAGPPATPPRSAKTPAAPPAAKTAPPASTLSPGSSAFPKVQVTHNVVDDGMIGMKVEASARFGKLKGTRCAIIARFIKDDETMVCEKEVGFTPEQEQADSDFQLFVPYLELAKSEGIHDLKLVMVLRNTGTGADIAKSAEVPMRVERQYVSVMGRER